MTKQSILLQKVNRWEEWKWWHQNLRGWKMSSISSRHRWMEKNFGLLSRWGGSNTNDLKQHQRWQNLVEYSNLFPETPWNFLFHSLRKKITEKSNRFVKTSSGRYSLNIWDASLRSGGQYKRIFSRRVEGKMESPRSFCMTQNLRNSSPYELVIIPLWEDWVLFQSSARRLFYAGACVKYPLLFNGIKENCADLLLSRSGSVVGFLQIQISELHSQRSYFKRSEKGHEHLYYFFFF